MDRSPWPLSFKPLVGRWARDWRLFALVFALVAAVFVGFGIWVYAQDRASIVRQQLDHLHAVAIDQVKELIVWQRERGQSGLRIARNPVYRSSLIDYLQRGQQGAGWVAFVAEVRQLLARPQYEALFLLDARGRVRYSLGPLRLGPLAAEVATTLQGQVPRFFADGVGGQVRVVMLTPILDARNRAVGLFGAQIVPERDFAQTLSAGVPFGVTIAGFAVGHSSAEILVLEGSTVIAPEPARHPHAAFFDATPLAQRFVAAKDESDRRVVGELLSVPGTDWQVMVRLDQRGFDANLVMLTFWAATVLLVFLITTGALTLLVWKWVVAQRRLEEAQAQRELATLEQRFDYLAKYANDAILLVDEQHRVVEVNDKAVDLYGYDRAEFKGLDVFQLRATDARESFEEEWGRILGKPSIVFETTHRSRTGRTFPVEVSARDIPVDGHRQVQAIVRDTSERKLVEAQAKRQANLYAALSRANEAIARYSSESRLLPEICRIVSEVGGFAEVYIAMAENGAARVISRCGAPESEDGSVGEVAPEPMLSAFRSGRAEYVNDYLAEGRTELRSEFVARGICSAAAFPLRRFARVVGVLGVASREANIFDEPLLKLLEDMALDVSQGLENIEREQRRMISERLVRDNELRYRSLFENMGSGVLVLVHDEADGFLIKDLNTAFETMEGTSRREAVGRPVLELFAWAAHCLQPVAQEVWRTGEPKPISAHRHPGLHTGWRQAYVYRLPTDELVAVVDDVSRQVESMEGLRHSEERLALVLEGTAEAFWDFNFESSEAYYSRRFAELFGYTTEELGGSFDAWQRLVHPNDLVQVQRELADHLAGRTPQFVSEHRMRHKEKGYLWVRARGRVVRRSGDGQPLRMAGTHADITGEREREERLREWAAVFEQSREAIIITDAERRILTVNRAFSEITGYAPEEVVGHDPRVLSSGVHDRAFYQTLWNAIDLTGHWQGEIQDRRKNGEIFPLWLAITVARNEAGAVQNYVAIASDISGRQEVEERLRHLSYNDALTGLANRALFSDRLAFALAHAQRHDYVVAVLFLDLDHFSEVNETLGYEAGDRLLMQVAERLRAGLRRDDTVARQAGDEFLVLFAELAQPEDAMFGARKMVEELARPYLLGGAEAHVTASIGIALYPGDGADSDTLLRHADAALYHAKERGRNNFQFFDDELNRRAGNRVALEGRLRRAIEQGDFVIHYQPQLALDSNAPVRAEALLRMRSDGTLLAPAEFLPLAEETGLVVPLGQWVLREACRQQEAWTAAGLPRVPIAINISAAELRQKGWLDRVREALAQCATERRIELEFDEQVLRSEGEAHAGALRALRDLGIDVALDNFGGGDASINSLRRFPVQHLKLDRALVREMGHAENELAEAVITLARSLGIRVVAQGVERPEELKRARARRCDEAQGRYVAPPLEADAFAAWWSSRAAPPP